MLEFFLMPVIAVAVLLVVADVPIAIRAITVVLEAFGVALFVRGLALRVEVGTDYVSVYGLRGTKRFDADGSRVRMQTNSGPIGGETFQLVIKREDGQAATYIPMILFPAPQIRPLTSAVCDALGV